MDEEEGPEIACPEAERWEEVLAYASRLREYASVQAQLEWAKARKRTARQRYRNACKQQKDGAPSDSRNAA
jgi:hypothetical protein